MNLKKKYIIRKRLLQHIQKKLQNFVVSKLNSLSNFVSKFQFLIKGNSLEKVFKTFHDTELRNCVISRWLNPQIIFSRVEFSYLLCVYLVLNNWKIIFKTSQRVVCVDSDFQILMPRGHQFICTFQSRPTIMTIFLF